MTNEELIERLGLCLKEEKSKHESEPVLFHRRRLYEIRTKLKELIKSNFPMVSRCDIVGRDIFRNKNGSFNFYHDSVHTDSELYSFPIHGYGFLFNVVLVNGTRIKIATNNNNYPIDVIVYGENVSSNRTDEIANNVFCMIEETIRHKCDKISREDRLKYYLENMLSADLNCSVFVTVCDIPNDDNNFNITVKWADSNCSQEMSKTVLVTDIDTSDNDIFLFLSKSIVKQTNITGG